MRNLLYFLHGHEKAGSVTLRPARIGLAVQKELIGLFHELGAFNERIVEDHGAAYTTRRMRTDMKERSNRSDYY
jgi:hypothetical protein